MAGKGVQNLIYRANEAVIGGGSGGLRKDGPVRFKKVGPWRVEVEGSTGRLFHYGTKMLEWRYDLTKLPAGITITGTWTGWGSVSDQTGVNAALRALGSTMRYARDTRGGGPRVNPRRRGRRNAVQTHPLAVSAITAATPQWMR